MELCILNGFAKQVSLLVAEDLGSIGVMAWLRKIQMHLWMTQNGLDILDKIRIFHSPVHSDASVDANVQSCVSEDVVSAVKMG